MTDCKSLTNQRCRFVPGYMGMGVYGMVPFDMIDGKQASSKSAATGKPSVAEFVRRASVCGLSSELESIRKLVVECENSIQNGSCRRLPGNAAFLRDGRILCRERSRGDSRYPYGHDGFNFWVNASGRMHANRGLFFLFLPSHEGQEPPISFFCGVHDAQANKFSSHAILPVPFIDRAEDNLNDRYTIIGPDATYFIAETTTLRSVVRVYLDQSRADHAHVSFSVMVQNLTKQPIASYLSGYLNPFCRHQFVETNEDRWFKKISVESHSTSVLEAWHLQQPIGTALAPFILTTNEDIDRFQSITNHSLLRRAISLWDSRTGKALDVQIQPKDLSDLDQTVHRDTYRGDSQKGKMLPLGIVVAQECTSRLGYIGSPRRGLGNATFLHSGQLNQQIPVTVFNENAIMGDLFSFTLPPDGSARADYVFSIPESADVLKLELNHPLGVGEVDSALANVRKTVQKPGVLQITVGNSRGHDIDSDVFNKFWPLLKKQVAVCATLKGYMHPSPNSLIGFRDVMQAIDGHLLDQPVEARAKILEAFGHVLEDGRCPRQYSSPVNGTPGKADLREFIDQGVWAISTIYNYLAVTGDTSLLDEQVDYHTIDPSDESTIYPLGKEDSVLEHLLRIMDYLSRQRDPESGLVLALYGDWNDALDGLGVSSDSLTRFGTGVSVMTSLQLYLNCAEMIEILSRCTPNQYQEHVDRYQRLRDQLRAGLLKYAVVRQAEERRILHGWGDGHKYLVGSFSDSDGLARDGLTSNAFWVLSGMLDEDRSMQEDILAAFERLDSRYGLSTFEPGFAPDAPGVGRITKLPLGTAENGATYIHATTFGIAALFQMGQPVKAWQQITKILPFASHHKDSSHSPFVMPNSYVNNPQLNLTGQSMNDWQTGCSNVLLKLLVRYAFGFQPLMDALRISPAAWIPFDHFELQAMVHDRNVKLQYGYGDVTQREISLNGKPITNVAFDEMTSTLAATLPYESLMENQLNVVLVCDPSDNLKTTQQWGDRHS
jgi:cellobiose phosphorylase